MTWELTIYRNSGNFRVKTFSSIKFSYQNIFVRVTPYCSNMHTLYTAMKNLYTLRVRKFFDDENFPNYSSGYIPLQTHTIIK